MNLLSTDNSFYRYNIETADDLSESCFIRRQTKARQHNKKSFFFSLAETWQDRPAENELLREFLSLKLTDRDVFCAGPAAAAFRSCLRNGHFVLKICGPTGLASLPHILPDYNGDLLLMPRTRQDLRGFMSFYETEPRRDRIYWEFAPYDHELKGSLTVKDICATDIDYRSIAGLEIFNTRIPRHYELAPATRTSYRIDWRFEVPDSRPVVSVIIPTFNNSVFLSNVVWHLINQRAARTDYEIIIADDGSSDRSSEIIRALFEKYRAQVNLTYIYWSKEHPVLGPQNFFRPGLARNLAARYSRGDYLFFLDSDMLVPPDFIDIVRGELGRHDVIQFQRFHIHQELSKANPAYAAIELKKDTYIEEKHYWSELFFCNSWNELPFYWKYTCTYALGIEKAKFFEAGLFKKYYISYGFEDTDLGYEAHKRGYRFSLVKTPLLHLTSYDLMQYKNSASRRFNLLKVTAELFFLQHLNRDVYTLLGNFYRSQKPLKALVRDLLP